MQNVLFLLGPFYAGKYFFSFHVHPSSQLFSARSESGVCQLGMLEALRMCPLCSPLLETPRVPQGTSFAPASSLCPVLILPGRPCLHWLSAQFGDCSSEERPPCRLGRVFLETALWYCWDRVYTSALCSRACACRAEDFSKALNVPWPHRIKLSL